MTDRNEIHGSEPHRISEGGMSVTEAENVLRMVERVAETQGELNGIAYRYGLVTLEADAATVIRRLKNHAEGVIQFSRRFASTVV